MSNTFYAEFGRETMENNLPFQLSAVRSQYQLVPSPRHLTLKRLVIGHMKQFESYNTLRLGNNLKYLNKFEKLFVRS